MKDREDERESERGKEGLSERERGRLFEKERERESRLLSSKMLQPER